MAQSHSQAGRVGRFVKQTNQYLHILIVACVLSTVTKIYNITAHIFRKH